LETLATSDYDWKCVDVRVEDLVLCRQLVMAVVVLVLLLLLLLVVAVGG
jgi:hypothetical protein